MCHKIHRCCSVDRSIPRIEILGRVESTNDFERLHGTRSPNTNFAIRIINEEGVCAHVLGVIDLIDCSGCVRPPAARVETTRECVEALVCAPEWVCFGEDSGVGDGEVVVEECDADPISIIEV